MTVVLLSWLIVLRWKPEEKASGEKPLLKQVRQSVTTAMIHGFCHVRFHVGALSRTYIANNENI